ncbi:unnamed protein product, partial [Ascophyllum nodosum]
GSRRRLPRQRRGGQRAQPGPGQRVGSHSLRGQSERPGAEDGHDPAVGRDPLQP